MGLGLAARMIQRQADALRDADAIPDSLPPDLHEAVLLVEPHKIRSYMTNKLGFSNRTANVLMVHSVFIDDLLDWSDKDLMSLRGFGKKALGEVRHFFPEPAGFKK